MRELDLMSACANRDVKEVERLLNAGARITATMGPVSSPGVLHNATCNVPWVQQPQQDAPDLVRGLILSGANIEHRDAQGCTPLYQALKNKLPKTVEVLLGYGADTGAMCKAGRLPIYWAIHSGEPKLYRMLVEAAPDCIHERDKEGKTALHWAAECLDLKAVTFLLNQQADANAEDNLGRTPLDLVPEVHNGPGGLHRIEIIKDRLRHPDGVLL